MKLRKAIEILNRGAVSQNKQQLSSNLNIVAMALSGKEFLLCSGHHWQLCGNLSLERLNLFLIIYKDLVCTSNETLHLHYKDHMVDAVWGNNCCLL
jgi:hypothetical protein